MPKGWISNWKAAFASFYLWIKHKCCKSQLSNRHLMECIFVKCFQGKMAHVGKRTKNQEAMNTQTTGLGFTKRRSWFLQRQGLRRKAWVNGSLPWVCAVEAWVKGFLPWVCAVEAVMFWVLNAPPRLGCQPTNATGGGGSFKRQGAE